MSEIQENDGLKRNGSIPAELFVHRPVRNRDLDETSESENLVFSCLFEMLALNGQFALNYDKKSRKIFYQALRHAVRSVATASSAMMAGLINPGSLARERSGQDESAYHVVMRISGVLNMRSVFGLIIAAVFLTGCQIKPVTYDVPRSQTYDRMPVALWPAVTQAVERSGMTVTVGLEGPPSLIAGRGVDQPGDWATCKRARVIDRHDDKSRRGRGWPVGRMVQLVIDVEKVGDGSKVSLRATFIEEQINPFKNLPFQVRCRSTGVLERSLLDAIDRG